MTQKNRQIYIYTKLNRSSKSIIIDTILHGFFWGVVFVHDFPQQSANIVSGQIIATSHDLTLWFSKGNSFIATKSRLVKYYNLAR